jgi:hypothetical protein
MKSLLEFKDLVEEEKKDYSKFDSLIRAGLANKAQIQRIHKIMDKMGEERPQFNTADREIIRNLFNRMADLISNNKQIFTQARRVVKEELDEGVLDSADFKVNAAGKRYRAHKVYVGRDKFQRQATIDKQIGQDKTITEEPLLLKDPPNVLLLKRITVRGFPDGTKVALYYNRLLDKHFTIPYGPGVDAPLQAEETELTVMESLQYIAESTETNVINFGTDSRSVDPQMARNILKLYGSLSEENKNKMEQNLNDPIMFDKFHDYSLKI